MDAFVYTGKPQRVVFGAGSTEKLRDEIEALGASRVMVICGAAASADTDRVLASLSNLSVHVYRNATMHVPLAIANEARGIARELGVDCCVTIGGGSATGLGKAIALTSGLPLVAIPTTYAGSEVTAIYGYTEDGIKTTGRHAAVLPKVVLYDPNLTLTLPPSLSASSGMNAMAHCVEALYAHDANPITSLMAEEGLRSLAQALPSLVTDPGNATARHQALYGAWLSGMSLDAVSMGLHHKLCHVLGGAFDLPHAETHAIILPHATRYNRDAAPASMRRIANALSVDDAPAGLHRLLEQLALPRGLKALGMPETGITHVARLVSDMPYANPAPMEYDKVVALLQRAYAGDAPER